MESLDTSISLSVINPSEEEVLWNKIYYQTIPFESKAPLFPDGIIASRVYIETLINSVIEDKQAAQNFVEEALVKRRYGPLYQRLERLADKELENRLRLNDCYRDNRKESDGSNTGGPWKAMESKARTQLKSAIIKQASTLRKAIAYSDGVGAILLANHVEQVANSTVGWRNVATYLKLCFAS